MASTDGSGIRKSSRGNLGVPATHFEDEEPKPVVVRGRRSLQLCKRLLPEPDIDHDEMIDDGKDPVGDNSMQEDVHHYENLQRRRWRK